MVSSIKNLVKDQHLWPFTPIFVSSDVILEILMKSCCAKQLLYNCFRTWDTTTVSWVASTKWSKGFVKRMKVCAQWSCVALQCVHKWWKSMIIRVWLYKLHELIISLFMKHKKFKGQTGLVWTHMPSFLPMETRHETETGVHLSL